MEWRRHRILKSLFVLKTFSIPLNLLFTIFTSLAEWWTRGNIPVTLTSLSLHRFLISVLTSSSNAPLALMLARKKCFVRRLPLTNMKPANTDLSHCCMVLLTVNHCIRCFKKGSTNLSQELFLKSFTPTPKPCTCRNKLCTLATKIW